MSATLESEKLSRSAAGRACPLDFSVAETLDEVMEAWALVYDAYRQLNLVDPNPWGIHCTPHALTNDTAIIRGDLHGRCVTTMTGYLDHPVHGLPLDSVYPDELARLRDSGGRLIEIGLFADRRGELKRTRATLLELMRWGTYFGLNHGAKRAVIGVHPHHAKFYSKCLGFEIIGEETSYGIVNGAPVVPMYLDWEARAADINAPRGVKQFTEQVLSVEVFTQRKNWRNSALTNWAPEQLLAEEFGVTLAA